jgi:SAM-dependent methyltransferase
LGNGTGQRPQDVASRRFGLVPARPGRGNAFAARRALVLAGDACALPLADASADLIVSRGSVMFWKDLPRAFAEVRRALAPHGRAYLGGGLGTPQMRETICRQMASRHPRWASGSPPPPRPGTDPETHEKALRAAGVTAYRIEREDAGHWIVIGG